MAEQAEQARDGREGELYEQLWTRAPLADVRVGNHVAVGVTFAELQQLSGDPRWRNVDRRQEELRRRHPNSGLYGTLGTLAIFVVG